MNILYVLINIKKNKIEETDKEKKGQDNITYLFYY